MRECCEPLGQGDIIWEELPHIDVFQSLDPLDQLPWDWDYASRHPEGGVLGLGADVKPCPTHELVPAVRSGSAPPEVDGDTRSAVLPATATDAGISGRDGRERGRAGTGWPAGKSAGEGDSNKRCPRSRPLARPRASSPRLPPCSCSTAALLHNNPSPGLDDAAGRARAAATAAATSSLMRLRTASSVRGASLAPSCDGPTGVGGGERGRGSILRHDGAV